MAPRNKHEPRLALAAAAIADAFESRADSRPEAGPCPHPYQDVPGTVPGRLSGREVKWGGLCYCKTWHLQLQHTRDGRDRWAWGQYQGGPVGGVRAKPSTLQPTPTAGSLKMVPRPLRTLTTATQPRESTQGGRPQACVRDTPPAPQWDPAGSIHRSLAEGLSMRLTLLQGQHQAQSWGNIPWTQICHHREHRQKGQQGLHSLQDLGFST